MPRLKQFFRRLLFLLAPAVAVTVLVAWGCTAIDVLQGSTRSANAIVDECEWTVQRWDMPGATYVISESIKAWPWGASQATGAPDTPTAGDQQTAWASATPDAQREWLVLEYAKPVTPKWVRVYESYNPGAVDRVTVFDKDDREVDAWAGVDPTAKGTPNGVSEIPLNVDFPVRKLKLYINSPAVPGWNEIDAVSLVSRGDEIQWARKATASSNYGTPVIGSGDATNVRALLPAWGGILGSNSDPDASQHETRAIDGRGWPLPALWCERDVTTGNATAGAIGAIHTSGNARKAPVISPSASAWTTSIPMSGWSYPSATTPSKLGPALPIRIAWPGFLADVSCYTIAIGAAAWLLVRPWRLIREVSRMRNGHCISCGYDLGYDFLPGCPECGWRREKLRRQ